MATSPAGVMQLSESASATIDAGIISDREAFQSHQSRWKSRPFTGGYQPVERCKEKA
nr:hypothetical protein [uncultured Dyadobacter sp.]